MVVFFLSGSVGSNLHTLGVVLGGVMTTLGQRQAPGQLVHPLSAVLVPGSMLDNAGDTVVTKTAPNPALRGSQDRALEGQWQPRYQAGMGMHLFFIPLTG